MHLIECELSEYGDLHACLNVAFSATKRTKKFLNPLKLNGFFLQKFNPPKFGRSREMPEAVELATVQLPGRENRFREPLLDSIDTVIPLLLEDFKAYLDKPYVLFGHSLGGLISFELTRALRRQRLPLPHHLILSGTKAPHLPLNRKMLHNLPSDKLISELFIYNGMPKEILNGDKELMELFLPIIRADFKIRETYVYKEEAPLICNITVLCGIEDPTISTIETKQWEQYTLLNFKCFLIPGDHFFIKSAQKDVLYIRQILKNNV